MAPNIAFLSSVFLVSSLFIKSGARLVPGMYVFGDSLVDVGNNNYLIFTLNLANYPPNGIDYPTKEATGRFCNGKNVADLLGEKLGLPTLPPYLSVSLEQNNTQSNNNKQILTGVNFASGGSGILTDQTSSRSSLSLTRQVDYFVAVHEALNQQLGPTGADHHFGKSIFLIVTGSNDIINYIESDDLRNQTTAMQYLNSMYVTLEGQVKRLYELGARKFVVEGLAVIGCIPIQRVRSRSADQACNGEVNRLAAKYNNEFLMPMLKDLKLELEGLDYSYFDFHLVSKIFIEKPPSKGFSEVKAACCGLGRLNADMPCLPTVTSYCSNRSNHLFWDGYGHPTEAANRVLADYMFHASPKYTFPFNVNKLVSI